MYGNKNEIIPSGLKRHKKAYTNLCKLFDEPIEERIVKKLEDEAKKYLYFPPNLYKELKENELHVIVASNEEGILDISNHVPKEFNCVMQEKTFHYWSSYHSNFLIKVNVPENQIFKLLTIIPDEIITIKKKNTMNAILILKEMKQIQ